jgi:hypothetical protein
MSRTRIAITPGRPSQPAAFLAILAAARRANSWAERGRLSSVTGAAVRNAHGDYRGTLTAALAPSMPLLRRRADDELR